MPMPGTKEWRDGAEGDLIDAVRRNDDQNFRLTITCRDGQWTIEHESFDPELSHPDLKLTGKGRTFADAWHEQKPAWIEKP